VSGFAEIEIRTSDFSLGEEYEALRKRAPAAGACVVFTGLVRGEGGLGALEALELEHYPGMAEDSIAAVIERTRERWPVQAVRVIHRVGRVPCGEQIVLVGVAAPHRAEAFAAAEFLMDYLKTEAPIWKKELGPTGERWVECRARDAEAAARWSSGADTRTHTLPPESP
jgi:molybdopterin synthase catalytic subunit